MIKKKYVEFETVLSNICTSNGSSVIFFSDKYSTLIQE